MTILPVESIDLEDCRSACALGPGGGGVLPYVILTETCGPIGYGFQGVLS